MSNTIHHSCEIARALVSLTAILEKRGALYASFSAQALYMYHFGDFTACAIDADGLPLSSLNDIACAYSESYGKIVEARTMQRRAAELIDAESRN